MRVCTVVGARPQFIKAAVVGRAFVQRGIEEDLVHTGQHYDQNMSDDFFDELELRRPTKNLGVGSGSHAAQTGRLMVRLEEFLINSRPYDVVLVYGDTNSTLAAALVGSKLHVPVVHVEAGVRSFNRRMPEEINRVVTDRLSTLLLCPTPNAVRNLRREGIVDRVRMTGDVMLESLRLNSSPAAADDLEAPKAEYALCTLHRPANVDDRERLQLIFDEFARLDLSIVWPVHPRVRNGLDSVRIPPNIKILTPVSYLKMLALVRQSALVITDSGGLQKEAIWLGVRCITLRSETEWVETLAGGWNQLVEPGSGEFEKAFETSPTGERPSFGEPPDATPSAHIIEAVVSLSGS